MVFDRGEDAVELLPPGGQSENLQVWIIIQIIRLFSRDRLLVVL